MVLIANSLALSLHYLLKPHPEPLLNVLGRTVYLAIDSHFRQSNEWVKQEILGRWESVALTNPRETYNKIMLHDDLLASSSSPLPDSCVEYSADCTTNIS